MEKYFNSVWIDNPNWKKCLLDEINVEGHDYKIEDLDFQIISKKQLMDDLWACVKVTIKEAL